MTKKQVRNWFFIDEEGTFRIRNPDQTSYLYFPLVNEAGMMSCVTPTLHGDIKTGQNAFLTRPVSVEDLHESRAGRNFWVMIEGYAPWSAAGASAPQTAARFQDDSDDTALEAGFLWHIVTRRHKPSELQASITNFVPAGPDQVELMKVSLVNTGDQTLRLRAVAAVPIYGRSADNLRDHRHVTSLLHRTQVHAHGIVVQPTLSFDERGHLENELIYAVLGAAGDGEPPAGTFPVLSDFCGEGGSLDWPQAIVNNKPSGAKPGDLIEGYEAMGGLRFAPVELQPGEAIEYVVIMGIYKQPTTPEDFIAQYGSAAQFDAWLAMTIETWKKRLDALQIRTGEPQFDGWMRWVAVQPTLRRLYGNSFLPYHDYGRGGRGWRDLWQDILGLLLMESEDVGETLSGQFAGIRFDGSNATIIGQKPGEFKADRNNIPRVWMDHGAWPLLTTQMYIDWSGDLGFLLRNQVYFKDQHAHRCTKVDHDWLPEEGTYLKTPEGDLYQGSILEHLLVQNLTPFFHVGEHNCIRLEGADWNDAMDMAQERGESVAFTGFYTGNLARLANLVDALASQGHKTVTLASELTLLLDRLFDPVSYDDPAAKNARLGVYFDRCAKTISGEQVEIQLERLAADLREKANWMKDHLRKQEWLSVGEYGWFNGYYDNLGRRVEGAFNGTVQMTLTGQVFQLMAGVATQEQAEQISRSVERYLYNPALHGVCLNTRFEYNHDALGRGFGFAYGHKENGAMFSHMAVMYAYALYLSGLYPQANKILAGIYEHCQDFAISRMYPGIPEYLNDRGRGMYPYLTGSASWYLLTMVTQAFGVRGSMGDLIIQPALMASQFDAGGTASIRLPFAGRQLEIALHNPNHLEPDTYTLRRVLIAGAEYTNQAGEGTLKISRQDLQMLPVEGIHRIDVYLENRNPSGHETGKAEEITHGS